MTDNGIHLTAGVTGVPPWSWKRLLGSGGDRVEGRDRCQGKVGQVKARRIEKIAGRAAAFSAYRRDARPPHRPMDACSRKDSMPAEIHARTIATARMPPAPQTKSVCCRSRHSSTSVRRQSERLRQTIVAKNRLYFYRWRPENETYLFGFRKHEQGQNAREIPQFDPLIAEKEKEIAKLRVPVRPHLRTETGEEAMNYDTKTVLPGVATLLCLLLCLCVSVVSPSVFAQRDAKVPDPDPETRAQDASTSPTASRSISSPPIRCWPSRSR